MAEQITTLKDREILEDGEYLFLITNCYDKESKSGNPMKVITLDYDGFKVYDNLVLIKSCEWKLKQFFKGLGDLQPGGEIEMNWDVVGRGVSAKTKFDHEYTTVKIDSYIPRATPF